MVARIGFESNGRVCIILTASDDDAILGAVLGTIIGTPEQIGTDFINALRPNPCHVEAGAAVGSGYLG
jgi:hypothetical protein